MDEQLIQELHNIGQWLGWIATWLFLMVIQVSIRIGKFD